MSSQKCIVVADDETSIRQLIKIFLSRYHFDVLEAATGAELLDILKSHKIDLVVLDLMLPDTYGIDLCKTIRQDSDIPVIILTAVQGEMNTVLGFEAGADDYIEKPFSAHVLLSRIQAILKRVEKHDKPAEPQSITNETAAAEVDYQRAVFTHWTYLPSDGCIKHNSGKHIFLTKNECLLLELFLFKEQEILSREKIGKALGLDVQDIESRAIDVQISRLRNKLKDKSQNNFIKSIRNKGYLFTAPVRFIRD